jgi:MraZ protein
MARFTNTFRHALDAKNRVTIPAKWREPGDDKEDAFLLSGDHELGCIMVYPKAMAENTKAQMSGLNLAKEKSKILEYTKFWSNSEDCGCDKAGRISLSDHLRALAGLAAGELVLAGGGEFFSIWSPERFAKTLSAPANSAAPASPEAGR